MLGAVVLLQYQKRYAFLYYPVRYFEDPSVVTLLAIVPLDSRSASGSGWKQSVWSVFSVTALAQRSSIMPFSL